ncbi:Ig-like domain-containing protein [Candidatus Palauibacter sp.]|uniref:Ig-like domain-containing protein n=1 Tax=Candidatus Palauibacter sp. TaxID=3101350 RepID=UPI003B01F434
MIPSQIIATGQTTTLDVVFYFNDPDGGPLTYTAATSAAAVVSVAVAGGTLTLVGVAEGTASVTVTATDPDGLTAAQGFQVTVETPNRTPEAVGTIPAQTVGAGASATLDVAGNFRDPDGDALTYTAASSAAGVVSASMSGSVLTLSGVSTGTATVTVTAADPAGLTAAQGFQVTVETPNRAPEAVGTIPAQTVVIGASATLDVAGNFRDPDGDALTYTAASSAAGVVTVSMSGGTLILVGVAAGTATVTVTAADPGGLTATQAMRVTAGVRRPGFRDDFDSAASLRDWGLSRADASVSGGFLHLTTTTDVLGMAFRSVGRPLTEWTIQMRGGRSGGDGNTQLYWETGNADYPTFLFMLVSNQDWNWSVCFFSRPEDKWFCYNDVYGHHPNIRTEQGQLTDITLRHEDGRLIFMAGSDVVYDWLPAPEWRDALRTLTYVWVGGYPHTPGAEFRFDFVDVTGTEGGADRSGDADLPPGIDQAQDALKAAAGSPGRVGGVTGVRRKPWDR